MGFDGFVWGIRLGLDEFVCVRLGLDGFVYVRLGLYGLGWVMLGFGRIRLSWVWFN